MNFLLDTCVISELVAKRPNAHVIAWSDGIDEENLYLSAVTIGEIRKGIAKLNDSGRKLELQLWLHDQLLPRFGERILPINTSVMLEWGELAGALEQKGMSMPALDSLIAATARHGELTLVTRNEDDFRESGVKILNPWK
jgi:tRNA(fMet)-specific endonuclease VapC